MTFYLQERIPLKGLLFHLIRENQGVLSFVSRGSQDKERHRFLFPLKHQSLIFSGSENTWIDEWMNEQSNCKTFSFHFTFLGELHPGPCMSMWWVPGTQLNVLPIYSFWRLLCPKESSEPGRHFYVKSMDWENETKHLYKVKKMSITFTSVFT